MKLRTEMRGFADGTHYAAVKAGDTADAIIRDAAAAHAFWLAIHEQSPRMRIKLHERALTIMREWGFDSGEVE